MAAGCPLLVGVEVRSGQRLCFQATFPGLPKVLGQMLIGPSQDSCQDLGLAGWWVILASPRPLMVGNSSSYPFPPVPQARLGAWPPVCWQDWWRGGRRGNFKLSGQNVKFTHEFTQQKEGEEARAGTPHARVLSVCFSPPSSPTLLFSPKPKQAEVPRPGGRAVLTLGRSGNQAGWRQEALKQAQRLLPEGSALPGAHSLPVLGPRP